MPKRDKKQRQKARRQTKKQEMRRRDSVSPVKRLADAPGELECWMSPGIEDSGQAAALCWKRGGGLAGVACFLVDCGVVGLKDAWTRMNCEKGDFEELREQYESRGTPLHRVKVEVVQKLVAGGARWAHDNGMRLPKDWLKAASLIGGVGDWANADVTGFIKEFAGHPQDLRNRLLAEPFETYIQRTDIDFVFSNDAPYEGSPSYGSFEEDDESLDDMDAYDDLPVEEFDKLIPKFTPPARKLAEETAKWLEARGERSSPELVEAWRMMILASLLANTALPDAPTKEVAEFFIKLLNALGGQIEDERFDDYERALRQAFDHFATDKDMMTNSIQHHALIDAEKP